MLAYRSKFIREGRDIFGTENNTFSAETPKASRGSFDSKSAGKFARRGGTNPCSLFFPRRLLDFIDRLHEVFSDQFKVCKGKLARFREVTDQKAEG